MERTHLTLREKAQHFWTKFGNDVMLIVVGTFLQALSYAVFVKPYSIVPGGVYGITIALNHITRDIFSAFPNGLPIGTMALFFNVPLFLLAAWKLGLSSGWKTILTFLLIALFTDFIGRITGGRPIVEHDELLSSFYGGAILGLGVFLVFKAGGTSAGTDVLARVLTKGKNSKLSTYIIIIDSIVVIFGLIVFWDWKVPLYSWIVIFIYGKVISFFAPENPSKAVFIVSDYPDLMRQVVVEQLNMRGTFLFGKGMYAGKDRQIVYLIAERKDLNRLKKAVKAADPKAFISTADAANDSAPSGI